MGISLITTVKNEEHSISAFLSSICRQTRLPDEVVIVDGGSTDATVALIREWKGLNIRCVEHQSNIAAGRNIAIRLAAYDTIAVTDAGCRVASELARKNHFAHHGCGCRHSTYRPVVQSLFDACQASVIGLFGSDQALEAFLLPPAGPLRHFASRHGSASEVTRSGWTIPKTRIFTDSCCRRFAVLFAPDAVVEWEQRKTLASVFRQFFRYMEGEALGGLHASRNLLRFAVYLSALLCLLFSISRPGLLLPMLLCGTAFGIAYSIGSYRKFIGLKCYPLLGPALFAIPALLLFADVAKMAGYLSGLIKLIRRPTRSPIKTPLKSSL